MRKVRALLHRLFAMVNRRRCDHEIAEELETNLQFHIDDNIARGMTPDEARRQALIRLGGMQQTAEAYRGQSGLPVFERFAADVRFALRMLRKDATFTSVTVLTLALGIGSATAVFTVANAVLMRRMPYPGSKRI